MKISYTKYLIILLLTFIVCIGSSLAYYSWGSTENTNIAFDVIADSVYVYYDSGADIIGANLYPTDDKEDGIKKEIIVSVDRQIPGASFNLYLDLKTLPDALKEQSFVYALYGVASDDSLFNIGTDGLSTTSSTTISGNFSTTGVSCTTNGTNHIVLLSDVNPTVADMKYILYIWIDGVNYTNPNTMMNQEFEFTLHADGINLRELETAVTYLTSLYSEATKTSITTAGGEAITQASTLGLMQDSFGNIRYYGADPDNYVTFDGETVDWRIIGIFNVEDENGNTKKRVKLIDYSAGISGDCDDVFSNSTNDWTYSQVKSGLNDYYYSDLTTEVKDKIGQAKYYLGGSSEYEGLYADDYYNFERAVGSAEWVGNIALMYPSDYAYATDLSICLNTGSEYNNDCKTANWMGYGFTISPYLDTTNQKVFAINPKITAYSVVDVGVVFPVMYVNYDVDIISGEGTEDNPYVLG